MMIKHNIELTITNGVKMELTIYRMENKSIQRGVETSCD